MAAKYDLASDFRSGDELKTQVPYWVLGVVRFANQVTWDPTTRKSISANDDVAMAEREPLVLTSEVVQVSVTASKDAHVSNLSCSLYPHENWLSGILPGDWLVCCMVNSETRGKEIAQRMRDRQAINGFQDGLKFLGRVTACRKNIQVNRQNGTVQTGYSVQGVGFGEFDSLVFFHPQLQAAGILPQQLEQFGMLIQDIVNASDGSVNGGTVDINKVLPKLVDVIFGIGAWSNAPGIKQGKHTEAIQASPNTKYLVPRTISAWLGLQGAQTYNDILNVLMGVQHYRTVQNATEVTAQQHPWSLFQPDGLREDQGVFRTPSDLIGWFPLSPPPTQATVWDMISGYTNPPINEMYLTLRPDQDGDIFPHLVVRQTPYSSDTVRGALAEWKAEADRERERLHRSVQVEARKLNQRLAPAKKSNRNPQDADATEFLEIPRWKLPGTLLYQADIGRSDAARFNMVHVSGTGYGSLTDETGNFVRAPPVMDTLDIKRNGLRPYMTGVNCVLRDLAKGPKVWRDIMSDIVMSQHLTLSGQITCVGIQAPISHGDNLEFENVVFHIESIRHQASIQPDGTRTFQTLLQVSHGIETDERQSLNQQQGQSPRQSRFAGTDESEQDLLGTSAVTVEED